LVTSAPTVCVGKQGRNDIEQAAFEVNAGYEYQLKREYFETPEEADGPARFFKPMLAEKWEDLGWDGAVAKVAKLRKSTFSLLGPGIYSQPKLDGFCCIAQASGLTSREGQPIVSVPHIEAALAPFFHEFPDAVLHGELYNHDLNEDFEELSSILKKSKPGAGDLVVSAQLAQFHVYDYPSEGEIAFGERSKLLEIDLAPWVGGCIRLVDTTLVLDPDHLDTKHFQHLEDGYEGQIVRLDLAYEQKRSWSVLKRKIFESHEYAVEEIMEGKGNYAGVAKRVTCRLPDGRSFGAGIRGKKPFLKSLLSEDHKVVTIRHFGFTGDGIPRMGVATNWHGSERTL